MNAGTQNSYILRALMSGKRVNALDMVQKIMCLRTASRINDLRNKGYKISKDTLRGAMCNYAEYYMTADQRAHAKKMGGGK